MKTYIPTGLGARPLFAMLQLATARVLLAAAILTGAGCAAKSEIQPPTAPSVAQQALQPAAAAQADSIHVRALEPDEWPDEAALKQLVGETTTGASVQLGVYSEMLVVDRISSGLQAARRVLTTGDGHTIAWGFKYGEGNLESVVIADKTGRVELAAVVDDVVSIAGYGSGTITSVAAYHEVVKSLDADPHVVVFARNSASLETAYPLLKSWMQANLLGFNASCMEYAVSCALMPYIDIPTDAYLSSGADAAPVKTAVPAVPAAPIPPEKFTQ